MFCVQVDFFALSLALPRMAVDLNETTTNMQWVLSAYMIAVGAAMIPGGRLGDLRGHRRIVVAGLAVFGGASLICGLSFSYGLLIGFRAVQGLGAAALFTVSVAAISNAVASDHRPPQSVPSTESRISEPHSARLSAGCSLSSSVGAGCSSSTSRSLRSRVSAAFDGCPRSHLPGRRCASIGWDWRGSAPVALSGPLATLPW